MVMLRWHGVDANGLKVFQFVMEPFQPPVDIRSTTDAVLINLAYRAKMLDEGYARDVTDDEATGARIEGENPVDSNIDPTANPDPNAAPENPADGGKVPESAPDGAPEGDKAADGAEKQASQAKEPPPPAGDGAKAAAPAAKTGAKK